LPLKVTQQKEKDELKVWKKNQCKGVLYKYNCWSRLSRFGEAKIKDQIKTIQKNFWYYQDSHGSTPFLFILFSSKNEGHFQKVFISFQFEATKVIKAN